MNGNNKKLKSNESKFLFKITPHNLKRYEENSVYFTKPRLVAYYECNYGNITNAKRIPYLKIPNSDLYPIDLNNGFETFIRRRSIMYLQNIELSLKYEMTSTAERDGANNVDKTKVITRRGTLLHIMDMYYKNFYDEAAIRVSRYNGIIYMVREELDDSLNELTTVRTHHRQLENLVFVDSPNNPHKINEPCDENILLIGVHRSNFGKYDIIYSGEIQGIISSEEFKDFDDLDALNNCRFVLTKQMWLYMKNRDMKYLNFWLQSYLANVKDIYIGHKNKKGIVEKPIEYKNANDLPKNRFWKPAICTGLLHEFLQNVERRMSSVNCLNTVYVFSYNKQERSYTYKVFKGKSEKTFITKEYMEYCKNMS